MKRIALMTILAFLIGFTVQLDATKQAPKTKQKQTLEKSKKEGKKAELKKKSKKKKKPKFKKYSEVITKKAKTQKGIITVHRVDKKIYYEFTKPIFSKPFLWVTQLSKTQTGAGWGGLPSGNRVIKWERKEDHILLRDIQYRLKAKAGSSEAIAVEASSIPAIISSFKIVCFNKKQNHNPVIDVTGLFIGDVAEFSPKNSINASSLDKKRTFMNGIKVFKTNIETRVLATYRPKPKKRSRFSFATGPKTITVEIHHSMIKLPEKPMMARIADNRIGYFGHSYQEYSDKDQQAVKTVRLIHRFRLEKKFPDQKISVPKKPIVFYIGRGVPEKYKKYVKMGIEDWQPAFEQAGFKNAIIGKYAPSKKENPNWDAEDARYSSVRWLPSTIQNAMGPHVADPRSGETLEADILLFHNVLKLARNWYYVQASPSDPRSQKLPLPDDVMGALLRFIACHEVGHSLGLRHNFKASSQVSIKQARDPKFTRKYGHTPSIMDYARFNYIAQPGDGATLIPKIGPYDRFAIEWGYKRFKGVRNPMEEKQFLNKIAARQLKNPLLRFGYGREAGVIGSGDPTAQTEDLGDNAIEACTMGMKNLERVLGYIVEGTSKSGENYVELREMYRAVLNQFYLEARPIATLIGGVEIHNRVHGMKGEFYTTTSIKKQKQALQFLNKHYFNLPKFFLNKDVIRRIGLHNINSAVLGIQKPVLNSLFSWIRGKRIEDIEAAGYPTYSTVEVIDDLGKGIFSEVYKNQSIPVLRRNLQREFVRRLDAALNAKNSSGDLRSASRYQLKKLARDLANYTGSGLLYKSHVSDLMEIIKLSLAGKKPFSIK